MPQDITIDDRSPLISYSGNWDAKYGGLSPNETMSDKYYESTFHQSETHGDRFSVKFRGTAIYIYGSKRPNHGHYTVSVDGGEMVRFDGYAPAQPNGDDGLFRQLLYSQPDLEDKLHEISLANDSDGDGGRTSVDIDYVVWTSSVSSDAGASDFDDAHPNWSYHGNWATRTPNATRNQTVHSTRTEVFGSYASLTFEGDAIYLYGAIGMQHGSYNVSVDATEPVAFNGRSVYRRSETILYFADNLGPGTHTLTATNTNNSIFSVDYARVLQSSTDSGSSNPQHRPKTKEIVIGTTCGALLIFLLGLLIWYIRQYRQKRLEPTNLINSIGSVGDAPPPGYGPSSAGPGWYAQGSNPRKIALPYRREQKINPFTSRLLPNSEIQDHQPSVSDGSTSYDYSSVASDTNEPPEVQLPPWYARRQL